MMQQRNNTGLSGRSRGPHRNPIRRATWVDLTRREPATGLRQQKVSAYRLRWEALRTILETIYPGQHLRNVSIEEDYYVFEVQWDLTPENLLSIEDARGESSALVIPAAPVRRETSEEPST
ncbi:hypothetical protein VTL71DRAFT_10202 [Oculimacula yallundae]|uniref:Uncharacterized protein n=1 Tax=Oculimacula yallundae TaxID=86028 RepID=A0ABR4BPX4_9HELO